MNENMTLNEFLKLLSKCSGDDAIEVISRFQAGALTVEGIGAEDFD